MAEVLNILFNVIAPVFIVVGISFVVGRRFRPDARSLSVVLVYMFTPALVFRSFATMQIASDEFVGIAGVAVGVSFSMMVLGIAIARFHRWPPDLAGAFIVSAIMVNAANYGIPVNQFAFGDEGAARAVVYYAVTVLVGNALGIFFASGGAISPWGAVKNVLSVPLTYAAVLGMLVNAGIVTLPLALLRAANDIAANGAIPGMMVLLGLKLAETSVHGRWRPILWSAGLRLLAAPAIALPLALLLGLSGVSLRVALVESAMPTAVLANALVTQFGGDAQFTSAATMISTVLSIFTLAVLLSLLI